MASNDTPFNKQQDTGKQQDQKNTPEQQVQPKQNHGFEQHLTRLISYLASRGAILQEEATDMIASMHVDTVSHKAGTEKVYDPNTGVVSEKKVDNKHES